MSQWELLDYKGYKKKLLEEEENNEFCFGYIVFKVQVVNLVRVYWKILDFNWERDQIWRNESFKCNIRGFDVVEVVGLMRFEEEKIIKNIQLSIDYCTRVLLEVGEKIFKSFRDIGVQYQYRDGVSVCFYNLDLKIL